MATDAPIIMAAVTVFALVSYFIMPEESWLPRNRISHFIDSKGVAGVQETVEEIHSGRRDGKENDDEAEGEGREQAQTGPSGSK